MIMQEEAAILKAKAQFEEITRFVRQAAGDGQSIHEVEEGLWRQMLSLGRHCLESFVEHQGDGDLGSTLERDGKVLRRLEKLYPRRYVSVFGEITIERRVYGTRDSQKHERVPLDARLDLPQGDFSYLLQDWDQSFCVQGSYEQSRGTAERILGIGQSVRGLEHINRAMAADVAGFHAIQPTPAPAEEGPILVFTADGKGVPMRRDRSSGELPARGRRKKGDKANKKRQACVGGVYTVAPFVRSAEEVVDEVLRDARREERPKPAHKQLRAELTRVVDGEERNGKDAIFSWFAEQCESRRGEWTKHVVCLMDGDRALWKTLKKYFSSIICVLDLFHVMERLWTAAHCFCAEGSDEAERFVTERLRRILEGDAGRVIGGLKQMQTKHKLSAARNKQLSAAIGYLQNNRQYMRYEECLREGLPIGSGVVEGACRHLVKDRMELTGMHWQTEGAQAMLDLRAVYLNGHWEGFQQYRVETERAKLYPQRQEILSKHKKAA